ncbi:MAG: hypothetical protein GOV01_00165 [Candidatus Altiarchaeota archaeon]|nr:hypothetical protein [Candidatus Altiarchaeota archaeon]
MTEQSAYVIIPASMNSPEQISLSEGDTAVIWRHKSDSADSDIIKIGVLTEDNISSSYDLPVSEEVAGGISRGGTAVIGVRDGELRVSTQKNSTNSVYAREMDICTNLSDMGAFQAPVGIPDSPETYKSFGNEHGVKLYLGPNKRSAAETDILTKKLAVILPGRVAERYT